MEIMVRTVQLLDQRLALNEEQVRAMRSELLQRPPLAAKDNVPLEMPKVVESSGPEEEPKGRPLAGSMRS